GRIFDIRKKFIYNGTLVVYMGFDAERVAVLWEGLTPDRARVELAKLYVPQPDVEFTLEELDEIQQQVLGGRRLEDALSEPEYQSKQISARGGITLR
ncbi:MAG: hypothetical protein IH914_11050, partial [candidate division Zixibacteria bacterium]|nr:hypothetical protein [candidate division Zixibacteria bacterium]